MRPGIMVGCLGIYDEPEFYEAALPYRDVPVEVDALLRWSGKHRRSGLPRSVLELAACLAETRATWPGAGWTPPRST